MATLTVDKPCAHEEVKAQVQDAVAEAKRAVEYRKRQLEDLRDDAAYRIKKAPLASVGIGVGAGMLLGLVAGFIVGTAIKKA